MSGQDNRSTRRAAWLLGSGLLLVLGIACLAVAVVGLLGFGGGVSFAVLALPLLAAGVVTMRNGVRLARVAAATVALAYAVAIVLVATAPLRGLTPPPGQTAPGPDPAALLLAAACAVAGVLVLTGDPTAGRASASR